MRFDDAGDLEKILGPASQTRYLLIAPVFNDFACAARLLHELVSVLPAEMQQQTLVLLVDDGSTETSPVLSIPVGLSIFVMRLHANLGHQRAIAVALGVTCRWVAPDATVVVMDCDGEDRPADVQRLIESAQMNPTRVTVANRTRRTEPLGFRIGYLLYKLLYRGLTGHAIRHGNFSAMSGCIASRLAFAPSLWNHYAATLDISRIPIAGVEVARGQRYVGISRMNFVGLITHGLSAISVHIESASVRMLVTFMALGLTAFAAGVIVTCIKLFTPWAIPGWASTMVGLFSILAAIGLTGCTQLIFSVLAARVRAPTLVALDSTRYVESIRRLAS